MDIQIGYRPAQALARVILDNGEQIRAESGAMVGMSTNVHMHIGTTMMTEMGIAVNVNISMDMNRKMNMKTKTE